MNGQVHSMSVCVYIYKGYLEVHVFEEVLNVSLRGVT